VLRTIELDRGCFACMLGGVDERTLFMMAADWRGPTNIADQAGTGQVLTVEAPAPRVGWP
jgi:sugar lactone lactonase YvrE